ncbi:MAG: trypsin-like peptidase domain-containing protein, partial [Planctomycetaceae bacterium]|nr:trypsin-like peptidase domain-containing protein [Planctomycetaceae bacterium]
SAWIVVALLGLIALLLYRYRSGIWMDLFDPQAVSRAVTPRGELSPIEKSQIEIFQQASPSVVHITSVGRRGNSGTGTGFLRDRDGYVVTNYHVVVGAEEWHVTLSDNTSFEAKFVGGEPGTDVAVLKIGAEPGKLSPIPIGASSDLQVGQNVYAIGTPFGLEQTLTTGVISGLGRQIQSLDGHPIDDVIQTDAAINPGNSGGPLLDSAGRAIGMNTAIFSPSGVNAGVGFAIPIDSVNRLVPDLIREGSIERPALGVLIYPDAALEQMRDRGVAGIPERGVVIREVLDGSSAEQAGLRGERFNPRVGYQLGDVIVGIDDQPIDKAEELFRVLRDHKVGDEVQLSILRDGNPLQVTVTLQARPAAKP